MTEFKEDSTSLVLAELMGAVQMHYARLASLPADWAVQLENYARKAGRRTEAIVQWMIQHFGMHHTTFLSAPRVQALGGGTPSSGNGKRRRLTRKTEASFPSSPSQGVGPPTPILALMDGDGMIRITLQGFLGAQMPYVHEWLADGWFQLAQMISSRPPQGVVLDLTENPGGSWMAMFAAVHWLCDKLAIEHFYDDELDDESDLARGLDIVLCQAVRPGLPEKPAVSQAWYNPFTHQLQHILQHVGTADELSLPVYTTPPLEHSVALLTPVDALAATAVAEAAVAEATVTPPTIGVVQHRYTWNLLGDDAGVDHDRDTIQFVDSILHTWRLPVAILVSKNTASAAEILVMLLRRFCSNVRVFGERTAGYLTDVKAVVFSDQSMMEMESGVYPGYEDAVIVPDVATDYPQAEALKWLKSL